MNRVRLHNIICTFCSLFNTDFSVIIKVLPRLKSAGINFTNQLGAGSNVFKVTFLCLDGRTPMLAEFVNTEAFAQNSKQIDFDVNNLKVSYGYLF